LNEDDNYKNQFFNASDPVEFLISETGIAIPEEQKQQLRDYIQGLSKSFPARKVRFMSDNKEIDIEMYFG
jgi:hypothetical protein